jgi:hypothetical protein
MGAGAVRNNALIGGSGTNDDHMLAGEREP